ncbi:hypothetical protein ACFTZB_10820 [Rhodococcus sp. NPDC057014]|uniref:hypothetical protein n=1 Tax=Rhodococcus sp. NPDC057014 TaxID=3346000 RepID=UPI00363A1DB4
MRETDPPTDTTEDRTGPVESVSPVTDPIVWPEPSPLESWWEHVVHDHPAPPTTESVPGTDAQ